MPEDYILNEHNKEEFPPAHTAEHLLNQLMQRMFGCERSRNAHIERKKSKISYFIDHKPDRKEEREIEQTMNVQYDAEGKLSHKYIIGEGTSSVCPSLEEAEAQANAMARINLLSQCDVECKALLTSTSMQNDDVTEAHVENASVDVIASKNQFFGYTVKSTYAYDNVSAAHISSFEMYYNDELLMRNYETETNVESEINWEAVTKYGSVVPYAQNAWRITRMYRKVRGGYEALVRVCNYAYTTEK